MVFTGGAGGADGAVDSGNVACIGVGSTLLVGAEAAGAVADAVKSKVVGKGSNAGAGAGADADLSNLCQNCGAARL